VQFRGVIPRAGTASFSNRDDENRHDFKQDHYGVILVCLKWVALRPDVDPVSGEIVTDTRWSGVSLADQAALELALVIAGSKDTTVIALTVGPIEAEEALRDALACGADEAVRVDGYPGMTSIGVAKSISRWIESIGAHTIDLVICGDWSIDRGSGSVPVFVAEQLGRNDACGLVRVEQHPDDPQQLSAERRLDGGRREELHISFPAVISVEGVAARLRRASLTGILRGKAQPITQVRQLESSAASLSEPVRSGPYRPRTRILEGPATSLPPLRRVEILTGALTERNPPRKLTLDPEAAADAIVEQLAAWGYELPT
jgi:electron transfer flavoprotein beta subunit